MAPLAMFEDKKVEAGVERGIAELTEHVSKSKKRSLGVSPAPMIPPKPQLRPLMQVRSWANGDGPIKESSPMSSRNSSPVLHWNPMGTPLLLTLPESPPFVAHQHILYWPPAAVGLTEPQLTMDVPVGEMLPKPAAEKPGTIRLVAHVSKTR
jgi:hypothetical protein